MGTGTELVNQIEALYNKHDWEAVASLYTSDAVYIAAGVRCEGRDAIRANFAAWNKSFPDMNVERFEILFSAMQLLVIAAQRRAAIAGDKRRGVEIACGIELALHHRDTHQRLQAVQVDPARFFGVFIFQRNLTEHAFLLPSLNK